MGFTSYEQQQAFFAQKRAKKKERIRRVSTATGIAGGIAAVAITPKTKLASRLTRKTFKLVNKIKRADGSLVKMALRSSLVGDVQKVRKTRGIIARPLAKRIYKIRRKMILG